MKKKQNFVLKVLALSFYLLRFSNFLYVTETLTHF